jgi:hypothetical protein
MASTLLLNRDTWDLCLDINGNIAVATEPYALAQDVASACKLFAGELYYDTTKGVPYFQQILGKRPPLSVFKAALVKAALTVPGIKSAVVFITGLGPDREIDGQIQATTTSGGVVVVALGTLTPL